MEDFSDVIQDMRISEHVHCSYFGVYDGHSGEYCAKYIHEQMPLVLKKHMELQLYQSGDICATMAQIFQVAFREVDTAFHSQFKDVSTFSGSTVVVVLILGSKLFCANTGDSRAVLCKEGKAIDLSVDHKASNPSEMKRIVEAGGDVKYGRAMGAIAISRTMGDFRFKDKPILICDPEVRVWDINPNEDEFVLMGSDGLFDKFSSQEAVDGNESM